MLNGQNLINKPELNVNLYALKKKINVYIYIYNIKLLLLTIEKKVINI